MPEHTLAGLFHRDSTGNGLRRTRSRDHEGRRAGSAPRERNRRHHRRRGAPGVRIAQDDEAIDGEKITGWFTEDFTLAELKTLRARERLPELRRANTRYDGEFAIPTFDEVLDLVAAADAQRAANALAAGQPPPPRIGVYPETKHPSYFAKLGLHFDERMLEALTRHGYGKRSDPICLQSFEVGNLKALRRKTDLPLVQLVAPAANPLISRCRAIRGPTQT